MLPQIQLVEIPLPEEGGEGAMETLEFTEGEIVTTEDGETYLLQTDDGDGVQYSQGEGSQVVVVGWNRIIIVFL